MCYKMNRIIKKDITDTVKFFRKVRIPCFNGKSIVADTVKFDHYIYVIGVENRIALRDIIRYEPREPETDKNTNPQAYPFQTFFRGTACKCQIKHRTDSDKRSVIPCQKSQQSENRGKNEIFSFIAPVKKKYRQNTYCHERNVASGLIGIALKCIIERNRENNNKSGYPVKHMFNKIKKHDKKNVKSFLLNAIFSYKPFTRYTTEDRVITTFSNPGCSKSGL